MQTDFLSAAIRLVMLVLLFLLPGCGKKSTKSTESQSELTIGSSQWKRAAAEDISVRLVAVLQRPAERLSWTNEGGMLQLTDEEKKAIATNGVMGQLEAVYTTGRGGGSREVRVVIIQEGPLRKNARLTVPETGSAIYFEKEGLLTPLFTNFPQSSLSIDIEQGKKWTMFYMDSPRDLVRTGGAVFVWDDNGKWHKF